MQAGGWLGSINKSIAFMYITVICNSIEMCHGHWEIINLSIDLLSELLSKQPKSFYSSKNNKTKDNLMVHWKINGHGQIGQIDLQ